MIPSSKVRDILKRLLERSKADEVRWLACDDQGRGFAVQFPHSRLSISLNSPPTEPDFYDITFWNENGQEASRLVIEEGDELWPLALEAFNEASRYVTGWDKVLNDVEAAINSKQPVGLPEASGVRF